MSLNNLYDKILKVSNIIADKKRKGYANNIFINGKRESYVYIGEKQISLTPHKIYEVYVHVASFVNILDNLDNSVILDESNFISLREYRLNNLLDDDSQK
jgi:hypothetical protein